MGGKLTVRRTHISRVQLFHLMQWIEKEAAKGNLAKTPNEIYKQSLIQDWFYRHKEMFSWRNL